VQYLSGINIKPTFLKELEKNQRYDTYNLGRGFRFWQVTPYFLAFLSLIPKPFINLNSVILMPCSCKNLRGECFAIRSSPKGSNTISIMKLLFLTPFLFFYFKISTLILFSFFAFSAKLCTAWALFVAIMLYLIAGAVLLKGISLTSVSFKITKLFPS